MKKLFGIVLFSVVGILLISGVGVTIIDDVSENIVSQENNTSERYIIRSGAMDLDVTYEGNGIYNINGESLALTYYSAVICDDLAILFNGGENGSYIIRDMQNGYGASVTPTAGSTIISIVDGEYSYTISNVTNTGTTETVLYPSSRGDYGSFSSAFNINPDETAYVFNTTSVTTVMELNGNAAGEYLLTPCVIGSGTVFNAFTGDITPVIDSTPSADGKSYTINSVKFTIDDAESSSRMIFAPIWYDVVDTNAQAVKDIVGVIPIILILILIIGVAYGLMSYVKSGRSEL